MYLRNKLYEISYNAHKTKIMDSRKKILVIDDENNIRENIVEFLEAMGYTVAGARDGVEAVQKAIVLVPDLIVCDINLPGMNGYEVLSTLDEIPITSNIPFIFVSAKSQINDIRTGMNLGADDYITKPFQFDDLLGSIKKRFEKHERLITQNEEKFNALVSTPHVGVFMVHSNRFVFVNQKFSDLTDCRENNLIPDFASSFSPHQKKQMEEGFERLQKGHIASFNMHIELNLADGTKSSFQLFANAARFKGKFAAIGSLLPASIIQTPTLKNVDIFNSEHDDEEQKQEFLNYLQQKNKMKQKKARLMFELTAREKEILSMICEGFSDAQIADRLFISPRTVNNHRNNLLQKTGANNAASLVAFAYNHGLFSEDE